MTSLRGFAIPSTASNFSISTATSAAVVTAGANVRGIILHTANCFVTSTGVAADGTSVRFGNRQIVGAQGANGRAQLNAPLILPPGTALEVAGTSASLTASEGFYTLL